MAVVALKATEITNLDSSPPIRNFVSLTGGRRRRTGSTIELTNGDSIGSTYRMARVPSIAIIDHIWLYCDAITTCAGDFGIYQTAANGGAVVDADVFASAQSLASALVTAPTDVNFESAQAFSEIASINKRLWERLQLTADSNRDYDVTLTLTAAAGSGGTVTVLVEYVVD